MAGLSAQRNRKRAVIVAAVVAIVFSMLQAFVCYSWTGSRSSAVLPLVGLVGLIIYVLVLRRKQDALHDGHPERLWLVLAIVLGVGCSVLLPFDDSPDFAYHYVNTYYYSNLIIREGNQQDGMEMRRCDSDLFQSTNGVISLEEYKDALEEPFPFASERGRQMVKADARFLDTTNNWPQVRLPGAFGIAIGRLMGLNACLTYELGELFNLAYFLALVYWAIRVTPACKNAFMAISLMPMTISLASSYSYDAGIIGLAFLLTAFCFKAVFGAGPLSRGEVVAMAVLAALLAPAKAIYSLIALIALATPSGRFESRRQRVAFAFAIVGTIALMLVVSQLARVSSMVGGASDQDGKSYYSMSWLLGHPVETMTLFARTIGIEASTWLNMMVAGPVGSLQSSLGVPTALIYALLGLLGYSGLECSQDEHALDGTARLAAAVLVLVMLGAVMLSMCIGWTTQGEPAIQGIQGRYLTPFMPLAMLTFRPSSVRISGEGLLANQAFVVLVSSAALNAIFFSCVYSSILMS